MSGLVSYLDKSKTIFSLLSFSHHWNEIATGSFDLVLASHLSVSPFLLHSLILCGVIDFY